MPKESTPSKAAAPQKKAGFPALQRNILLAKGVSDKQIQAMEKKGILCREDFAQVGNVATLMELTELPIATAEKVMSWALGTVALGSECLLVASSDTVFCLHCQTKQPKDYKSGDLCTSCGKQVEPIQACYWCHATGPGRFCRQCAAEFVPAGELELAILLKRDGLSKDEIPARLKTMSSKEKEIFWGRVRIR